MERNRIALLQDMAVFGALRHDTCALVLERGETRTVEAGDYFFREHEDGSTMYVIEEGTVAILKHWEGQDYELNRLGPGDCFGEMALIEACARTASVRAQTRCCTIELSTRTLMELYQHDLEQFAIIQMNMAREVSRRLRRADERYFEMKMRVQAIDNTYIPFAI